MHIFIGADHRGLELKNKIVDYLHEKNIRVEDMGPYELDPLDHAYQYAQKVAQAVLQNPQDSFGITMCGSGVAVSITSNRYHGIRCALGFDEKQVEHARMNDHINMLALPSEYVDFEKAKRIIETFIKTQPKMDEKYLRRNAALDDV